MPGTTTLLATALGLLDEGIPDDTVVAALLDAADGDPTTLAEAHAGAVFLLDRSAHDDNARRVSDLLAEALRQAVRRRWSSGRL